ncbi:Zn-ribbon domain-containing OB-fold protein [Streptomyces sp. NPDC053499]|uniref:Zn-ribbon domain-containing OB-fold protein n=1 Tax=Streptomyces sp. NPDC053499 TaxID=3365707 RepID=UPI0037D92D99
MGGTPGEAAPKARQRFDLPGVDAFTAPYWRAAAAGRLLIRRCGAEGCGAAHHYPREFCPHCWSEDVDWEEADGRATLYTWSVVHRNDLPPFDTRVPYVAAVVELAEGPRMMTEITGCPPESLRVGMELRVAFRRAGGTEAEAEEGARERERGSPPEPVVPVFRPAPGRRG